MPITVAEKTHWKERIAKRIDSRIEMCVAKQDPTLLQRVTEEAHKRAYKNLGIDKQQAELEQIEKETKRLEHRKTLLVAEQFAAIKGITVEEARTETAQCYRDPVEPFVNARANVLEADILAETELGRQVLALRAEKDNLLDTVWLATCSSQIKELWEQVNRLLDVTPTALEQKALKIEPVKEE